MLVVFYLAAAVAIAATVMVISRRQAVHALLYLVVAQLALAMVLWALGAPFVAALEVIIYAGAIVVLFLFVVMMLNLGDTETAYDQPWLQPRLWIGPGILAALLLAELFYVLSRSPGQGDRGTEILPREVGIALFGPYLIGVELAAMLLMAGVVGAYHLGQRQSRTTSPTEERHALDPTTARPVPGGNPVRSGADRLSRPA